MMPSIDKDISQYCINCEKLAKQLLSQAQTRIKILEARIVDAKYFITRVANGTCCTMYLDRADGIKHLLKKEAQDFLRQE